MRRGRRAHETPMWKGVFEHNCRRELLKLRHKLPPLSFDLSARLVEFSTSVRLERLLKELLEVYGYDMYRGKYDRIETPYSGKIPFADIPFAYNNGQTPPALVMLPKDVKLVSNHFDIRNALHGKEEVMEFDKWLEKQIRLSGLIQLYLDTIWGSLDEARMPEHWKWLVGEDYIRFMGEGYDTVKPIKPRKYDFVFNDGEEERLYAALAACMRGLLMPEYARPAALISQGQAKAKALSI